MGADEKWWATSNIGGKGSKWVGPLVELDMLFAIGVLALMP